MSSSKRILIVEDEMMIALHMEDTLAALGHKVTTATTSQEADSYWKMAGLTSRLSTTGQRTETQRA
jgi:DNA-binding response OmpR family regulator